MIILMIVGVTKTFIEEGENFDIGDFRGLLMLAAIFSLFQIIPSRLVFRATVNNAGIRLNNTHFVNWNNIKFVNRFGYLYILKTKGDTIYFLLKGSR